MIIAYIANSHEYSEYKSIVFRGTICTAWRVHSFARCLTHWGDPQDQRKAGLASGYLRSKKWNLWMVWRLFEDCLKMVWIFGIFKKFWNYDMNIIHELYSFESCWILIQHPLCNLTSPALPGASGSREANTLPRRFKVFIAFSRT